MSHGSHPPTNRLIVFTDSQIPLAVRYPQPKSSSSLVLPPLVHRTLHNALDDDPPSLYIDHETIIIPHPETLHKRHLPSTAADNDLDLTVKLHFVGDCPSDEQITRTREAMELLCHTKGFCGVDTLLVGWKGVDYKGKKTEMRNADRTSSDEPDYRVKPEDAARIVETWQSLHEMLSLQPGRDQVRRLGTLYLPLTLLRSLAATGTTPSINVLDTPDCHHLPREYTDFAKQSGIELWAGGGREGADPIPAAEFHNLLQEFATRLPQDGHGRFEKNIPLDASNSAYEASARIGTQIQWVMGYTLLSKTRNVVEDKGYILSAALL